MLSAGKNGYISDVSELPHVRAKQLWQFLASKIFFRLSCISQGQSVCRCGTHAIFPFFDIPCSGKPSSYTLSEYPCDIATDGYTYNYSNLNGCNKIIFS